MPGEQFLGLLAETFIHPGAGSSGGAVDLPVAREAATEYPFIPGSGLKGALRDRARQHWPDPGEGRVHENVQKLFGEQENAGLLLVSDARLLLLPVRSLTGAYVWATCPQILERLQRDLKRAGNRGMPEPPKAEPGKVLTSAGSENDILHLEERTFSVAGALPDGIVEALAPLVPHAATRNRLGGQVAVLSDDDFAWFARYGLAVQARNSLDNNKISNNLWYEETLPPDTLLYAMIGDRHGGDGTQDRLGELFDAHPWLQVGGNETVGQGWLALQWGRGG